ncbi:transcriptional regulator [Paenibacillus pectinilyticus]|uniref:Transcriptional regulator n=1 Tax=Paenibacillus pectinilyticus TaxID=512399 RepID=A0A1C1A5W9_9BACL|nr:LysR family transcriptional regulator [Paenibacillus pectinilyticus]OCT15945.1 transcriptional regulator [Paenibacillus pectinilyticus]
MDLKELLTFRTIIEEGSFTKAAAKLNYAQSTVTNQVQRLEKELGFKLFKRGWDAILTPSGTIYAEQVEGLIQHWIYVADQAKALEKEEIGTLQIGAIEPVLMRTLPAVLAEFRVVKPKVSCHFTMGNTEGLAQEVLANRIDFAVSGEPKAAAGMHFEPLYEEQMTFIVGRDHPLASRSELVSEDVFAYPLIIGGASCLYHARLMEELQGFSSQPLMHTVSQISAIPAFVEHLSSVGVVLASTVLPQGVVTIPVPLTNPNFSIGLLQNRKQDYVPSTQRLFMRLLRDHFTRTQAAAQSLL